MNHNLPKVFLNGQSTWKPHPQIAQIKLQNKIRIIITLLSFNFLFNTSSTNEWLYVQIVKSPYEVHCGHWDESQLNRDLPIKSNFDYSILQFTLVTVMAPLPKNLSNTEDEGDQIEDGPLDTFLRLENRFDVQEPSEILEPTQ